MSEFEYLRWLSDNFAEGSTAKRTICSLFKITNTDTTKFILEISHMSRLRYTRPTVTTEAVPLLVIETIRQAQSTAA